MWLAEEAVGFDEEVRGSLWEVRFGLKPAKKRSIYTSKDNTWYMFEEISSFFLKRL